MDPVKVEIECRHRAEMLLNKYFGEIVHDAAVLHPETVDEKYYLGLPLEIEKEFKRYLNELWAEIAPNDTRSLDDILNHPRERKLIQDSYSQDLPKAYDEAQRISLWEKITNSNHKDVTFFKGLLKSYAGELLKCMIYDFREEVKQLR